jgi:acyl-CoA thioesterase I
LRYFLIILLLVTLYIAFYYARIFYYTHYSTNPEIVQLDSKMGQGEEIKYIAAGDSTAVGEGATTLEKTYPVKIAQYLAATNKVDYKNIGVRGAKTSDVITQQLDQIIKLSPNIITISIGANDATHLVSNDKVLSNYRYIIKELTEKTTAEIYITNIPNFTGATLLPHPFISLIEHRSEKLNLEISKFNSDRVHIINIHDYGWDRYPDRQATYSLDHFHPSDLGYENWTNAFLDSMK